MLALCAVAVAPSADANPSAPRTHKTSTKPTRQACAAPNNKAKARCFALIRTDIKQHVVGLDTPDGFGPSDLQDAYNLPSDSQGAGQTVAIVDAFDDPNAEADLAMYRSQYGLPACTTDNGCFQKVNQRGDTTPLPPPDAGWAGEIALDIEMVSAGCPLCHILLVEADDNFTNNLATAVQQAVDMGAKYVSNSYGGGEDPSQTDFDSFYDHPGVAVTASTGDSGYGTEYPATAPGVTAVGGTSLVSDSSSRGWSESAWDGAGSGCSSVTPKPTFQTDTGCDNKTIADVSAVADPATGVAVYNSFQAPGWDVYGGTSVSSPLLASVYALAGQPIPGSNPESYPYDNTAALNDVTSGSNGSCDPAYLCTGGPGFDGPTGLGTPNGVAAFASGPRGTVTGKVTNSSTHQPIAGATITSGKYVAVSQADGTYSINLPTGVRKVMAAAYGYKSFTKTGITIVDGDTTTQNFALVAIPSVSLSGNVVDGSGHHFPLYAKISIDGAPGGPAYSSPFTGHYELSVPRGTTPTITVTPLYSGYQTTTTTVSVGSSDATKDLPVPVNSDCSAPGYTTSYSGIQQHFDTTSKPAGWTVADKAGTGGVWTFDDPGARGNLTGGSGNFAIIDSDHIGPGAAQDTFLVSPTVNLSSDPHPVVGLNSFYKSYFNSTAQVQYTVDGGTTWKTVFTANSADQAGPLELALPGAAHKSAVKVRFHYIGEFAYYWEVDDVYVGHRSCVPTPGGIVAGFVKDGNTALAVNSATVTSVSRPGESGVTTATPDDAALPDGFYHLFSSALGARKFVATKGGYADRSKAVSVPSNYVARADFSLAAGQVEATPVTITGTATLPGSTHTSMKVTNTGTVAAHVTIAEGKGSFVIANKPAVQAYRGMKGAAVHKVSGHFSPLRMKKGTGRVTPSKPTLPSDDPWTAIADYPTPIGNNAAAFGDGLLYSVGGFDGSADSASLYIYDPAANAWTSGADMSTTREAPTAAWIDGKLYVSGGWGPDGSPTGVTEAYDPGSNSWTTLAANPKAHAAAGGAVVDGKLYLVGGCTATACGSTDVQVYDPSSDSWASGTDYPTQVSWESCGNIGGIVYCAGGVSDTANLKSTYAYDGSSWTQLADMPVDQWGGAYAAANDQLVISGGVIDSNATITNQGWSYDPASDTWSSLPNSNNAFFRLGGACGLYKVGGGTGNSDPAHAESEVLPGYDSCGVATDVPWLAESANDFTLAPGASKTITVTMDSSSLTQPGTYTASLDVASDTPYPTIKAPVVFTVKPPATWGKISGVVLGKSCDGTTAPVKGATVEIDTWAASYTLTTEADGTYALFLDYRNNPLTMIVAKDGWKPQTVQEKVTAGGRKVHNFTLVPSKACT